jgi:methylenetetrahydrofolate--tRNA-(uracil-5-)-methyltransferase
MHRNTYINAPALLTSALQLKTDARIFFAGQISGVEGYVESIATGLIAGRGAARFAQAREPLTPARETALGSLCHYVSSASPKGYQPANIAFDLLPPVEEAAQTRDKHLRRAAVCRRALERIEEYATQNE